MTETVSLPSRKPYHRWGGNYNKKIITIYVISARIQGNTVMREHIKGATYTGCGKMLIHDDFWNR